MSFEEYLIGKKIDTAAFSKAEPTLFISWKNEYDQMHPNSFTVQKLNLINPIRRKYQLKTITTEKPAEAKPQSATSATTHGKPIVMKPKPKIS